MTENSNITILLPDQHEPNEQVVLARPTQTVVTVHIINNNTAGGQIDLFTFALDNEPEIGDTFSIKQQVMQCDFELRIIGITRQQENKYDGLVSVITVHCEKL